MSESPEIHIASTTPLQPAIKSWEVFLADQGRSPYTIKAFLGDMSLFAGFFSPEIGVGAISTQEINRFLNWLQKERNIPCSPKSLARRITSIKAFFRWLAQSGRIPADPAEKVVQQSVISPLPEVLTDEERDKLIQAALLKRNGQKPDARPYTLLMLLLTTGIKKGECLALNLNHIDLENPSGKVLFIRYANSGNRYKERKIELSDDWVDAYQEYLQQYKPADQVFPWSPRRLEYLLEDLGKESGLIKHLSFDMCRWTCVLNDWKSGEDREKIRQKLGISKIQWREVGLKLRQLAGEVPVK